MRFAGGHDYYDSVLQFGLDGDIFFERTPLNKARYITQEQSGFVTPFPPQLGFVQVGRYNRDKSFKFKGCEHTYESFVVWFAGERYPGVCLGMRPLKQEGEAQKKFFWGEEAFLSHLEEIGVDITKDVYTSKSDLALSVREVEKLFHQRVAKEELAWMIDNRISVAISSPHNYLQYIPENKPGWFVNCDGLGSMGFASCLDPYTAFQNLSQWIGGILSGQGHPMVKITDEKVILKKHGFDKQSFKHRPHAG